MPTFLFVFLALATALFGEDAAKKDPPLTFYAGGTSAETLALYTPATKLMISIGRGDEIVIDCKTGEVTLPKGRALSETAVEFWKAVQRAFPESFKKQPTGDTEWMEMAPGMKLLFNGKPVQAGLRSDGTVVWREVKP